MWISIVSNYLQSTIMQSQVIILFYDLDDSRLFSLLKKVIYTFTGSALFLLELNVEAPYEKPWFNSVVHDSGFNSVVHDFDVFQ